MKLIIEVRLATLINIFLDDLAAILTIQTSYSMCFRILVSYNRKHVKKEISAKVKSIEIRMQKTIIQIQHSNANALHFDW